MKCCFIALLLLLLASAPGQAQQAGKRMNVLFIAVDDLNTRLGCYGDKVVRTPHIDKLAARALRFDRAYCQYPLCNPTRASLLTGRRPDATKVYENQTSFRQALPDVQTLPQLFKENGYTTARVGKIFHGGIDDLPSWDIGGEESGGPRQARPRPGPGQPGPGDFWRATDLKDTATQDGKTATTAAQLLERLQGNKTTSDAARPFFLAVGFLKPHVPFVAPKPYFDRHDLTAAFTQVLAGGKMGRTVRTERWRYIEWEASGEAQLYDHHNDPHEYKNLAKDPAHAATVAEMKQRLKNGWRAALPPKGTS